MELLAGRKWHLNSLIVSCKILLFIRDINWQRTRRGRPIRCIISCTITLTWVKAWDGIAFKNSHEENCHLSLNTFNSVFRNMTGLLSEQLYISQFALMLVAAISAPAFCPGDSPPHGRSLCASWPSCCSGIWRCWIWSVIVHMQTHSDTLHVLHIYVFSAVPCKL